jgi:hypothetical protein
MLDAVVVNSVDQRLLPATSPRFTRLFLKVGRSSQNLYQLVAYLKNLERGEELDCAAEGMLVYPVAAPRPDVSDSGTQAQVYTLDLDRTTGRQLKGHECSGLLADLRHRRREMSSRGRPASHLIWSPAWNPALQGCNFD